MVKLLNPVDEKWRGSTNGYTGFANWFGKGGRSRISPVNRIYRYCGEYKRQFSSLCRAWQNLSGPEKAAWTTFSETNSSIDRYGNSIFLANFQWFIRYNTLLLQGENSLITTPPADPTPAYSPVITIGQHAITGNLFAALDTYPTGSQRLFYARSVNRPFSMARNTNTFRTQGFFDSTDPTPFTILPFTDIKSDGLRFKFRFLATDSFGRTNGLTYDDIVHVTT